MSLIRILVADDYEEWRYQVCLELQNETEWRVICEVSDGLEAVHKAEELKPDLILLDLGLPKLNGIAAAGRIRELSPGSKIIFVSLDNSLEVVYAGLNTGALGYVYKPYLQSELRPAVKSVLRGEQFVSNSVRGHKVAPAPGAKAPHRHAVQFYSDDAVLLDRFAHFIAVALQAGDVSIVVATKSHRDALVQNLKVQGLDIDTALKEGRYIQFDSTDTLSTFMVNGLLDAVRVAEVARGLVAVGRMLATQGRPRFVICGVWPAPLLGKDNSATTICLEKLCNEIVTTDEITVLCGYPLQGLYSDQENHLFQSICAEHSTVYS